MAILEQLGHAKHLAKRSGSRPARRAAVGERGKLKTKEREFPHWWERLRQWYKLESAKGREWSAEDAAENFRAALEDEISSFKEKGSRAHRMSCSESKRGI